MEEEKQEAQRVRHLGTKSNWAKVGGSESRLPSLTDKPIPWLSWLFVSRHVTVGVYKNV